MIVRQPHDELVTRPGCQWQPREKHPVARAAGAATAKIKWLLLLWLSNRLPRCCSFLAGCFPDLSCTPPGDVHSMFASCRLHLGGTGGCWFPFARLCTQAVLINSCVRCSSLNQQMFKSHSGFVLKVGQVLIAACVRQILQLHGSKQLCQALQDDSVPLHAIPTNEVITYYAIPLFV